MVGIHLKGDRPMKNRAMAIIMVTAMFAGGLHLSAFAQSSIGGVKKQTQLGAPVKPNSLGGPVKPVVPAGAVKPAPVVGAVKPAAPVVAVSKPAVVASSPTAKCPAPCVAKGPH
jgi:hypothetical protein